ncbi:MAG: MarR family transcriptional regulator [Archangiaceae bacterium]|nr:MarR family transcriptional regulator [Archangiaceae bacterium]
MPIPLKPAPDVFELMRAIWALDHALQSRSKAMARALGVTGPQRFVLRVLQRSPGLSAKDLAAYLHLHPSTLTGVLQRLEDRGLLTREKDQRDARRQRLTLTASGGKVLARKAASVEAVLRQALGREKRAEMSVVAEVLKRLTSALEDTPLP